MKILNQSRVQPSSLRFAAPGSPESRVQRQRTGDCGLRTGNCESGFTMVEIAICLAIIGFALIAIIGALPIGMGTQRDNREETLVNQDATVLMEAIRGGAHGLDNLTNYIYAITNYWTNVSTHVSGANGYTYTSSYIYNLPAPSYPINNGLRIIGLLSTPEYTDFSGSPIPSLMDGGYSNHVVAYVHSISGPAVEKPPQDNDIVRDGSFGYRVLCVNAPMPMDTNLFNMNLLWQPQQYVTGSEVLYNWGYWQATADTLVTDVPGKSVKWAKLPFYPLELAANLHELRLAFFWPQLPNGSLGPGHQSFRTLVAGQIVQTNDTSVTPAQPLYFYQSQSFVNAP
jgi:type II secretory pathway pseudopilin PulG